MAGCTGGTGGAARLLEAACEECGFLGVQVQECGMSARRARCEACGYDVEEWHASARRARCARNVAFSKWLGEDWNDFCENWSRGWLAAAGVANGVAAPFQLSPIMEEPSAAAVWLGEGAVEKQRGEDREQKLKFLDELDQRMKEAQPESEPGVTAAPPPADTDADDDDDDAADATTVADSDVEAEIQLMRFAAQQR